MEVIPFLFVSNGSRRFGGLLLFWLCRPLLGFGHILGFLILYTIVSTPWTWDQPVARALLSHRTIQKQIKHTQTTLPRVGFDPTIPTSGRAKKIQDKPCCHCDRLFGT
jgi:hypothetical protein